MDSRLETIKLSVGALAELGRTGDINYRFASRSSAREDIAAHKFVQQSRGDGYTAEHPIAHEIRYGTYQIDISGRIDGYFVSETGICIDEIKSVRVRPEDIPDDVLDQFWRQAFCYAFMLVREKHLAEARVRLCLYHLDEEKEYRLERVLTVGELSQQFVDAVLMLVERVERRDRWCRTRAKANATLAFPYSAYRPGQRDMAVSVYRQLTKGEQVVLQAPTGIGKTMGTLFPAIHALETSENQRVFYLSAKSSTQQQAETAAKHLVDSGARIRSVTLTAKEKICFSPGQPCDPEHCEFARGYYDRVRSAIADMLEQRDLFDRDTIEEFARRHGVCPFELSLDLSREADLIICDYNYVFDPFVYLRRYFDAQPPDSLALIDEVHNLVDRGRDMYSAELEKSDFLALARLLKGYSTTLSKTAHAVNRSFLELARSDDRYATEGYLVHDDVPGRILKALEKFCVQVEAMLQANEEATWPDELLSLYFQALRFRKTAEEYDNNYMTLLSQGEKASARLKLYCIDPSRKLAGGFARLAGVACFSATLQPQSFFKALLGISESGCWYQLPSPYPKDRLHVSLATHIDTSYRARRSSIEPIIQVIEAITAERDGGYLVFFPSYSYLESVLEVFVARHPEKTVVAQSRHMSESERQDFLDHFNGSAVCGFAVLGGVFGEGIDLKGERLIGAIIIGVGLPGLSIDRDVIRDRYTEHGFELAYQYPGIVKVLQTAGRVIRSEHDEGVVCLVDRRYSQARYQQMLPDHWTIKQSSSIDQLKRGLSGFWAER